MISEIRQGLRNQYPADPGFWVKWHDWKFYGDANVVYVEGHEECFVLPAEVKILHSYPQGVRADCGDTKSYLIREDCYGPELSDLVIQLLDEQAVRELDHYVEGLRGKT